VTMSGRIVGACIQTWRRDGSKVGVLAPCWYSLAVGVWHVGFFFFAVHCCVLCSARASASTKLALPCQGLGTGQTPRCPAGLPRGPPPRAPAPRGRSEGRGRGERGREGQGRGRSQLPLYLSMLFLRPACAAILRVFVRSVSMFLFSCLLCVCRVLFFTASASLVSLSCTSCRFLLRARLQPGPFLQLRL
jgi:hypothetical protein